MEQTQRTKVSIDYGTNKDYFAMRVVNDDMANAHFQRGAVIIVHRQHYASDGEIVLVMYNGKACLRYFREQSGEIYLTAAHNDILPVIVRKTDDFAIMGKVCELRFEM